MRACCSDPQRRPKGRPRRGSTASPDTRAPAVRRACTHNDIDCGPRNDDAPANRGIEGRAIEIEISIDHQV